MTGILGGIAASEASRLAPLGSPMVWLAGALAILSLVQTLRLWWQKSQPRRALRQRAQRGADGETAAEPLLRELGYDIEARQSTGGWTVFVDGEERPITVRADYLVARGKRRLVADVKTGELAPRIESAATRRQLLEYRLAFDVDGVLLVDVEAGEAKEVEFTLPEQPFPWDLRLIWLALGLALGLACALLR
jgi:hypothetical protein